MRRGSELLPMPASPITATTEPRPSIASDFARSSSASGASRSSNRMEVRENSGKDSFTTAQRYSDVSHGGIRRVLRVQDRSGQDRQDRRVSLYRARMVRDTRNRVRRRHGARSDHAVRQHRVTYP